MIGTIVLIVVILLLLGADKLPAADQRIQRYNPSDDIFLG